MFSNYCCCCFKTYEILLPITIKSSSEDSKMFLDYYSSIFGEFLNECNSFDFICIRCSKALQVAYHFINMVKENQSTSFPMRNGETILNDASFKEINHKIQDKQATPSSTCNNKEERNKFSTECDVECQTNKSGMSSNELVPLSSRKNFEVFSNDPNAEAESSGHPKEYNLDFMCIICNELFKNKLCFFEHNRQKHKEIVPYKCKLCSFYTCYTESLFKHREKNHGLIDVAIDLYETKLAVAPVSPSFGITYACTSCNFKSRDQTSIDEHLVKEHSIEEDVEPFVKEIFHCPLCYRSFTALKSAKIHYSMYHMCSSKKNNIYNKRKFSCEKCGKLFDLKSGLFLHRRICEELKPVACNFCNLQFTSVLKYERHLQERHSVAIRHECEICGKTFSCSEYLTVHRKRHNERYYQCDLCPKNYINNADLKVHKHRIHSINHTPIWATCSNLSILKFHENRKQIFKCGYCDFVSHSSYANKTHQYKHTGCRPYKCQICSKEFIFLKTLKQHIEENHAISLTNDEMAESFKKIYGYSASFDGFSKQNTALEIKEVNEFKLENELEEIGLTSDDIMEDFFNSEMQN